MKVILLRGISGSGKSTYANKLALENPNDSTVICTADDYFMVDGAYKFDKSKLGKAHAACLLKFRETVAEALTDFIIVANTNTTAKELIDYVGFCEEWNVPFEIITISCPLEVAIQRNVHSVPKKTIVRQHDNLIRARFPNHWNCKTIDTNVVPLVDFDSDEEYKQYL